METEQLSGWLWCLRTPIVQAYAVRERDGFNLIDTCVAGCEDEIVGALAAIDGCAADEVKVYAIALTHAHEDHCGSAAALVERTAAVVSAPATEVGVVEGRESLPPPALREWELPIWELVDGTVPTAPPVAVDTSLAPGDALPWERPAHALAAPGHTPGSVAFWFETERVLFAGDAIALFAGRPVAGVFNVDSALAQRSFAALAELDSDIACFGHGDPIRERAATILRDAR